ncbi:hypothetical protein [Caulobacter sp. NIBR1757]|uniref:hypothetical protein n=1 Tax=Caulobacter sp. NIBR1757 TaxID=3016000 RepID=UPI0022F0F848|nr:hypothetical protein [Caulobacter sp. NIBR1757]
MGALLAILAIPIMLLNWLGGIVGFIWLIVLGDWATIGLGVAVLLVGTFAIGLALAPGMLVMAPMAALYERGRRTSALVIGALGLLWTYAVLTVWCVGMFTYMLSRAEGDSIIPYLLWGYGAATGPWTYMAHKESRADPSAPATMTAFAAQLGVMSMMVGALIDQSDLSFERLAWFFVPFVGMCLVAQLALAALASRERQF